MNKTKKIILSALFLASSIVLGRLLSIRTPIIYINFAFVPLMLSGIILGPKYTVFIATISDIIGSLLFPTGSYFFGFTITAFLAGSAYGFILHRQTFKIDKNFIIRLVIVSLVVSVIINGVINTIWIIFITKGASNIIIPVRIAKELIMVPIMIITGLVITKLLKNRIEVLLND